MEPSGVAQPPLVTVVCPVFNEEHGVPLFYERLIGALAEVSQKVRFEFLFMNNRSTDGTLQALQALQARDPRVRYVTLSRNFGYQASITAGMRHAAGDAIVNIDVDCEDPPEMIPKLIAGWLDGADVVYGLRDKRKEFLGMHLARKLFYRVTRSISDHEIVLDMAEFFLVDRRVRDHVLATRSTFPFVRGQLGYVGFRRVGIPYTRERRLFGKSHYNLLGATRFGVGGILSSSTLALRMLAYVGVVAFCANLLGAGWVLVDGDRAGLNLTARILIAVMALQGGWMMLAFGTLGIYLARVYKDTMSLPLYVVDDRLSSPATQVRSGTPHHG
jgi:glycosyltransferase involved in cell wall biosynthesis